MFKTPYEISLWEDRLTLVDVHGKEYSRLVPNTDIVTSYYKEVKIAVIGSNELSFLGRAVEPQLKRNVNGTNTLTFSIYAKYYNDDGQLCSNPFLPFLVNERKVKLKYLKKGKFEWLDFVIKTIEEDSSNYKFTYIATDLFINELSKNGYSLEFNERLENNQGTVNELGKKILSGTDWQIGEDSEIIQQLNEEALYELVLNANLGAKNIDSNKTEVIPRGSKIYAFYSCIANKEEEYFQFLYRPDGNYIVDENRVVTNASNYYVNFSNEESSQWPSFAQSLTYFSEFRGERLVRTPITLLDPITDRIVTVHKDLENNEVYCYTETEYLTNGIVQNLLVNGKDFSSSNGWKQNKKEPLQVKMLPDYQSDPYYSGERESVIVYTQDEDNFLLNLGFELNQSITAPISEGEEYVARIKYRTSEDSEILGNISYEIQIVPYHINELGNFVKESDSKIVFSGRSSEIDSEGYVIAWLTSRINISQQDLENNKFGIFIRFIGDSLEFPYDIFLVGAELFKKEGQDSSGIYCPNGARLVNSEKGYIVEYGIQGESLINYYYYYPNQKVESVEDLQYISIGKEQKDFPLKYTQNFEKIRSITASESNRFNLLQQLSETFECWCRFDVLHKDTGEILLRKDRADERIINAGNHNSKEEMCYTGGQLDSETDQIILSEKISIREQYQQQKFITFHKNIGQTNSLGFSYGINLKSIRRKVESSSVVTKLIVKNNNNKFAEGGSCAISRAEENPTGENFLINFDHYISQGLLNYENFYNDLYSISPNRGWIGFYVKIKEINNEIQSLISEKLPKENTAITLTSDYESLKKQYDSGVEILREQEELFYSLTSHSFDELPRESSWFLDNEVVSLGNDILRLRKSNSEVLAKCKQVELSLNDIKEQTAQIQENIDALTDRKKILNEEFEKKYSRFIQEGSWISEDYVDDNLYYLDAYSTLGNSARPKIEYTISVIEISNLPEFKGYDFELGDITYIQDTEFFGWKESNGVKTPYKEKIVVTEMTTHFDSPEKNTINVRNHRTQFEDLFQRMAASTQKIEFQSGAYQRAADAVNSEGSIAFEALADAFSNNDLILKNVNNQSVIWDEKGITTTNSQSPSEVVRIVSGGIFLSDTGGQSWPIGITPKGINAKAITSGVLNTELITILSGTQTAFRWDKKGITAYSQEYDHYNNDTFVRFNQHGIYGLKNCLQNPESLEEIWDLANFALTWKGFKLQSDNKKDGYLTITSSEDLVLRDSEDGILLQLGRLGESDGKNVYGLAIGNQENNSPLSDNFQGLIATEKYLKISGWTVGPEGLYRDALSNNSLVGLYSRNQSKKRRVGKSELKDDWCLIAGVPSTNSENEITDANFGVDFYGNLYASNAFISGTIYATDGIIGGIELRPDPNDENGTPKLIIPVDNLEGKIVATKMSITDESGAALFMADDGTTDEDPHIKNGQVCLSDWSVTAEGLKSLKEDDNGWTIILTPHAIVGKKIGEDDKKIPWSSLFDKI